MPTENEWRAARVVTETLDQQKQDGWIQVLAHHRFGSALSVCPAVPRHNLKHVRELLEPLCRKHGIPYRSTGLFEGTGEILSHLKEISLELSKGPM